MITHHKYDEEDSIYTWYSTRGDGSLIAYWACHYAPHTWEMMSPLGYMIKCLHNFDTFDEAMSDLTETLKAVE